MADELIVKKTGELVEALEQQGLGEMLKPLIKEIHLFDSFVAGTTNLKDPSVLDEISVGDKLNLMREENRFDDNSILIITAGNKKLGYVPEKDNLIFARLMDAGKLLCARITEIDKRHGIHQIRISIFLVDF